MSLKTKGNREKEGGDEETRGAVKYITPIITGGRSLNVYCSEGS